ncbi:IPT/TIG domain-containing protein [Gracilinema caldarium]|uniref:IPT/TIG domain-containing protein n=1 Tax=Gracilinema caldarium TaxID=215591 RepID=UPI0026EA3885|nr:IPT/TIG domain-containing protein [Gracilinema caldarium]
MTRSLKATILLSLFASLFFASCLSKSPRIESIDPRIGSLGEVLTIRGQHFGKERGENYVTIGGIIPTASAYIQWQDDLIALRTPDFGDSGLVYVHVNGKRSNASLFTNRSVMPQRITDTQTGSGPALSSLAPVSGRIGSLVTLQGSSFGAARDKSKVLFSWNSENSLNALGDTSQSLKTVEVSDTELGYEYWSDREIRIRVPDGAISGAVQVVTDQGTSMPLFFDVVDKPGSKMFKDKKSYAISYGVDVKIQKAAVPNALYLWIPIPTISAQQRISQQLARSIDPFVENYLGSSLFQIKDLQTGTNNTITVSYVVDVYAVETSVRAQSVVRNTNAPIHSLYTQSSSLIPSDNQEIQKKANAVVGKEQNPYIQAQRIYEWLTAQGGIRQEPVQTSLIEAMKKQVLDAYTASLLFCAMARSLNIPAIPDAGVLVNKSRETRKHYWAEFWVDGLGWIPVDPAMGASAVPESFVFRSDAASYYFGNVDSQRISFSRGIINLSSMDPKGKIVQRDREYALQNIWEESTGTLESYSSLWSDVLVTGVY